MSKPQNDKLNQIVAYLNDSNGRDKFSKAVQYASRFLYWYHLNQDPKSEWAKRFNGLFAVTRDARKLPRLLKTLNEVQSLQQLIASPGNDPIDNALNVIAKIGMGNYWFFDNILYLKKANFYNPTYDAGYYSNLGWTVGLVANILINLRVITRCNDREAAILLASVRDDSGQKAARDEELKRLRNQRFVAYMNTIASLGDLCVASNGINLPAKLLGKPFNDGILGLGGLISALITGYYRWKQVNP